MKFINMKEVYNEKITPHISENDIEVGINDVWFEEVIYPMLNVAEAKFDSFALEDLEIKLDIRVNKLYFYCFSESQVQCMYVTLNDEVRCRLAVCDWGNEYIPEGQENYTKVFCRAHANNGMDLAIYENTLDLKGKVLIQSLKFEFNPAVHIVAIGYE